MVYAWMFKFTETSGVPSQSHLIHTSFGLSQSVPLNKNNHQHINQIEGTLKQKEILQLNWQV